MATRIHSGRHQRLAALAAVVLLWSLFGSASTSAQAEVPVVAYPATVSAIAPAYSLLGFVPFAPKSAVLSTSAKKTLAGLITKLRTASRVQIKSYYSKPAERLSLTSSRSAAVMTYFISKGFVPTFTVTKGTTSARKTQILWFPKEVSGQVNFTAPSSEPVTWAVPSGTKCLYFVVAGAKGGSGGASDPGYGGLLSFARRAVPGQSFNLYVGGEGGSASFYQTAGGVGGINGGAAGGALTDSEGLGAGGGGGGWSGVFQAAVPLAVAGGGGGSASSADFHTGAGGDAGVAGRDGAILADQSAGGPGGMAGTLAAPGLSGSLLQNVNAATGQPGNGRTGGIGADSPLRAAGGGGGGYFGGGGGAYSGTDAGTSGGGGGGSNLVPPGGVAFVAPLAADGSVSIKYSNWSLGTCKS